MEQERGNRERVVVVGGGVVGLFAALYLARAGRRVTVVDRETSGAASDGNAGMVVPSHVVPLAAPGVIWKGLRWLPDPESPFCIRPRADLDLLRWLWRFRGACTNAHVQQSVPVLYELSLASVALFDALEDELVEAAGQAARLAHTGLLMLHRTEKGRADDRAAAEWAERAGLDVQHLARDEVLALDPEIRTPFLGGVFYPQDGRVDPDALLRALETLLRQAGVEIRHGVTAEGFEREGDTVRAVHTTSGRVPADEVVLAAGAWTSRLADTLGVRLPVQPAKGYSITVDTPEAAPHIPHILTDDKLTVTPMPGRLRFAGTLALAGFDDRRDARRSAPLVRLARTYASEGDGLPSEPEVWYGYRPCSPDGLPLIGRVRPLENVVAATGHGMMGVTLAPITGKLVSEIVAGKTPTLALEPLRPDR